MKGQTAVGLDPINESVQQDVLQRGRTAMACRRSKSQKVRSATWSVSSMVYRSGGVVDALHRRKLDFCCAQETRWKCENACCCCMPSETYGRNGVTPIFRSVPRTASSTTCGWSRWNIFNVLLYIILSTTVSFCVHFHFFRMCIMYLTSFDGLF